MKTSIAYTFQLAKVEKTNIPLEDVPKEISWYLDTSANRVEIVFDRIFLVYHTALPAIEDLPHYKKSCHIEGLESAVVQVRKELEQGFVDLALTFDHGEPVCWFQIIDVGAYLLGWVRDKKIPHRLLAKYELQEVPKGTSGKRTKVVIYCSLSERAREDLPVRVRCLDNSLRDKDGCYIDGIKTRMPLRGPTACTLWEVYPDDIEELAKGVWLEEQAKAEKDVAKLRAAKKIIEGIMAEQINGVEI